MKKLILATVAMAFASAGFADDASEVKISTTTPSNVGKFSDVTLPEGGVVKAVKLMDDNGDMKRYFVKGTFFVEDNKD